MKKTKTSQVYGTSWCNKGHRVADGKPVGHECAVLPPEALQAEIAGDYAKAQTLIEAAKPMRVMRRGVRS